MFKSKGKAPKMLDKREACRNTTSSRCEEDADARDSRRRRSRLIQAARIRPTPDRYRHYPESDARLRPGISLPEDAVGYIPLVVIEAEG
jgi:hypothetical protein